MADERQEKPAPEDFFRSVSKEVTEVPIFEDEDGRWFAYGHLDPYTMMTAIFAVDNHLRGTEVSEMQINPEDIQYYYAKISKIDNTPPDWEDEVTFTTCKPTEEGAFPVTFWN